MLAARAIANLSTWENMSVVKGEAFRQARRDVLEMVRTPETESA